MTGFKIMAALLFCAGLAHAGIITPTSVTYTGTASGDAGNNLATANNIINGSGLSAAVTEANFTTVTHDSVSLAPPGNAWATIDAGASGGDWFEPGENDGTVVFEFDLGGTFAVDTLAVWGYHFNAFNGNSISEVTLDFSIDGGATIASSQTVAVALPEAVKLATLVALTSTEANHITMTVNDNHFEIGSGGDRVGITEVRFGSELVVPDPPPVITSFKASPSSVTNGGTTTLTWTTTDVDTASLDQGIGSVPASGSTQVVVNAETTFTLTVSGAGGSINASATVGIRQGNEIPLNNASFDSALATPTWGPDFSNFFTFPEAGRLTEAGITTPSLAPNHGSGYARLQSGTTGSAADNGDSTYQTVNLVGGEEYKLTFAVATSSTDNSDNVDTVFAIAIYTGSWAGAGESAWTTLAQDGDTWSDFSFSFTPDADGDYNIGIRNYTEPNGGADSGTLYVDNARLTLGELPPPSDPIGYVMLTGPIAITGGQGMTLSWDTTDGQIYEVQTKGNLIVDSWTTVDSVIGAGGSITVTTAVQQAQSFYRVITPTP